MAPTKIHDDELLDRLLRVFQQHGYEGASLTLIAAATGLGRASLYHRFPGGKVDMAQAVLDRAAQRFGDQILAPLSSDEPPQNRVRAMAERLREFYERGARSCVLHTLVVGGEETDLRARIGDALRAWQGAMEGVAKAAGLSNAEARRRASEALIRIQGSLVVSRGLDDNESFLRVLGELPELLTGDARD